MAQATVNKTYRTFVAGMITEATPLSYPENASLDEDNCVIFQKGNRTRRLGFARETAGNLSSYSYTDADAVAGVEIEEYSWEAVNENGDLDLLVIRVGNFVYFYTHTITDLAGNELAFSIDLRSFAVAGVTDVSTSTVSLASGKGYLFISGAEINPLSVEYLPDTASFQTREIIINIRDFVGVDDGLANDDEPATLSNEHKYNLRNQGWVTPNKATTGTAVTIYNPFGSQVSTGSTTNDPITDYFTSRGVYPGNNKQWFIGKLEIANVTKGLEAGDFDPELLEDTHFGNTRAPRGHFIFPAFDQDRSAISNVSGLTAKTFDTRPNSISFYAGRVWYGHESSLYYSQTLEDHRQAGNCYQEADPTSESISDLVATDGGVIPIPEAHNIIRIYPLGGGLVVLAENGLWFVGGGGGNGFSATDISVSKISSNGILGRNTLVEADGTMYWWSPAGIMSLAQKSGLFGSQDGSFDRVNISETTISSFYKGCIPEESKQHAKGIYDPIKNTVQWLFVGVDTEVRKNYYDRVLNLDVTLKAFYPWTIESKTGFPYVVGVFRRTLVKRIDTPGITTAKGPDTFNTLVNYLFTEQVSSSQKIGFGDFSGQTFLDFEHYTGGGTTYTSYMETGFEILDDLMRDKQQNYIFLYFRKTKDVTQGIDSSCFFQTRWDWSNSEISNRWSRKVEGYRITNRFKEAELVSTKHKSRGHGRALQIRFESAEANKTFDLLGWATHYTGQSQV